MTDGKDTFSPAHAAAPAPEPETPLEAGSSFPAVDTLFPTLQNTPGAADAQDAHDIPGMPDSPVMPQAESEAAVTARADGAPVAQEAAFAERPLGAHAVTPEAAAAASTATAETAAAAFASDEADGTDAAAFSPAHAAVPAPEPIFDMDPEVPAAQDPAFAPGPMPSSAPELASESAYEPMHGSAGEAQAEAPLGAHAAAPETGANTVAAAAAFPEPTASAASAASSAFETAAAPDSATAPASSPALDPADASASATTAEAVLEAVPDPTATSPEDTAEIDVEAVEAKLNDPVVTDLGSTQSFAPLTEERIDADSTFDAGTTTSLMWGARSDVGCVRSHNEDSYLVQSPLFCVCDGMGGHAAGEVASSIAVETIAKMAPKAADPALLGAAIEAANAAIIEAAINGLGKPGMGCTATAAYIQDTTLAIAHVGDSRAYLLHEGTLIRVTRDHSYVEELVDAGEITADEARVHPNRSVITRALGSDPLMYADHFQLNIEEGDRLILCSDGLSSMIPDGEIENIATQSSTAQICTDNLVDAALAAGGSDNVTVVVVDVVNDGHLKRERMKHRRIILAALLGLLAVLILGAVITCTSVVNSVYLGVKDDVVAVYTGVPGNHFGLKLHWLEDETSVKLADLPEDTQNRLREGIRQDSLDAAAKTVEDYRKQIDMEKERQAQNAQTIRDTMNTDDAKAADADGPGGADDNAAPANLNDADPASADPQPTAPAEGGAAQ